MLTFIAVAAVVLFVGFVALTLFFASGFGGVASIRDNLSPRLYWDTSNDKEVL